MTIYTIHVINALDEDDFWKLIEAARVSVGGRNDDSLAGALVASLSSAPEQQIFGFALRFYELHGRAYTSHLWCTAYVANGGCSDDGFDYFRAWLIGCGREVYYAALADPDSLVDALSEAKASASGDAENELLLAVAFDAYKKKTKKSDYYEVLNTLHVGDSHASFPLEFDWVEEDSETWRKICPRVFAKFSA